MSRRIASFDPVKAIAQRDNAAIETLSRVECDLTSSSWRTRPLLEKIRRKLFSQDLKVYELGRSSRDSHGSEVIDFHAEIGASVWDYISKCRLETAARLVRDSDLRIGDISWLVGYSERTVFTHAFRRFTSMAPAEFRGRWHLVLVKVGKPEDELHSLRLLEELRKGTLEPLGAERILSFLEALDTLDTPNGEPEAARALAAARAQPSKQITDAGMAAWCWELIHELSLEEKRDWVRHVIRVNSPAFFSFLGKRSLDESHRNPRLALEFAELALEHIQLNTAAIGAARRTLQALALAWRANALRALGDVAEANRNFTQAWVDWKAGGEDECAEGEICSLEAVLRRSQRRFDEALQLLGRAISVAQDNGCDRLLAVAVLQRVSVIGYTGTPGATIGDIKLALRKLAALDEPYLTLVAYNHLVTSCALAGKPHEALAVLPRAQALCEVLEEPVVRHQLQWSEGLARKELGELELSEALFQEARAGLIELDSMDNAALVSMDLAILSFHQGRTSEVSRFASEAIPVFEALRLPAEEWAAVELLREAIAGNEVPLEVLEAARAVLNSIGRDLSAGFPITRW